MSEWLNTTHIQKGEKNGEWNDFYKWLLEGNKPCHACGYCPYGQLVEAFPLHEEAYDFAVKMDKYSKRNPDAPGWIECDKDDEDAYPDIDYGMRHTKSEVPCKVFGHDCPAFYHAEPMCEEPHEEEKVNSETPK